MDPLNIVFDLGGKLLDRFVSDKTARDQIKAALEQATLENDTELQKLSR